MKKRILAMAVAAAMLLAMAVTAGAEEAGTDENGAVVTSDEGTGTEGTDAGKTDGEGTDAGKTDGEGTDAGEAGSGETDGEEAGGEETDGEEAGGGETDGEEAGSGETDGEEAGSGETDGETPVEISFSDVSEDQWFYRYVTLLVASGQMSGMGNGTFDPNGNLTVAQVLSLAARMDMKVKGITDEDTTASDGPWYARFVDYCVGNEIIAADLFSEEDMDRPATRFEMAAILDAVADESATAPINDVPNGFIPDLDEEDPCGDIIYKWYRAGITVGYEDHSFLGERTITRAETCVILCHLSNMVEHAVIE